MGPSFFHLGEPCLWPNAPGTIQGDISRSPEHWTLLKVLQSLPCLLQRDSREFPNQAAAGDSRRDGDGNHQLELVLVVPVFVFTYSQCQQFPLVSVMFFRQTHFCVYLQTFSFMLSAA